MAAISSNSKAPAASSASPLSKHIHIHIDFPAAYGDKAVQVGSDKAGTAESNYDKQAVDIVAIYSSSGNTDADQLAAFDSRDAAQIKTRKGNWLVDTGMIRSHVPVAGIVGFGLNLKSLNDTMRTNNSTIDLADIANEISRQLQDIRKRHGSRSVVFVGHGYGTLLIERLLNPNPIKNKVCADLKESTAAVVFFAAPFDITPLIEWTSRSLELSRDEKVFSGLQVRVWPEVWKLFNRDTAAWYMLTFAFREKRNKKEKEEEKDKAPPENQQDEVKESKATDEPQPLACLAPETWEGEDDIGDIARMSGPRDPKFRTMTEFLTRAIHTHNLLAAAKRGDVGMIKELAEQSIDVNLPNRQGETALHIAVQYDRLDVVTLLIETSKVDLDHQDESGMTALHLAVRRSGDLIHEIVEKLLKAGASPNLRGGPESETPVELAERLNSESAQRQPDGDKDEQLDSSQRRREKTKDLLKNPPAVSPPRPANRLVKEVPTNGARGACRKTEVVVREMFDTDSYIRYYTNIEQLIYESSSANDKKPANHEPEDSDLKASLDDFFQNQKAAQTRRGDISLEGKPAMCRWYHIPMNNMAWIHDLFATLGYHVWPWPQGSRNFTLPYSRTVYPQVADLKLPREKVTTAETTVWAIMMPYISYEEHGRQTRISDFIKKIGLRLGKDGEGLEKQRIHRRRSTGHGKWFWQLAGMSSHDDSTTMGTWIGRSQQKRGEKSGGSIKDGTFEAIKAYLNYKHTSEYVQDLPLHPRRTLDQSYYYMLTDTSFRDKTQVVSRWFRRLNRKSNRRPWVEDETPHNVLMVDQLWLWVFRRPGYPDTLITSFPDRKGAAPAAVDDLQRQILDEKDRDSRNNTGDLVAQILAVCCRTLSTNQDEESVNFLQCFEESIEHLEEKAFQLFQELRLLSVVLQRLDDSHPRYQKRRRVLLGELFDISRESKPLTEVRDILDEIKIIQTTLEDQVTVINSNKMEELESSLASAGLFKKARNMIVRASGNFEVLKSRAEAVEKSIEHLLDLKQTQANLWEARTSRENADETAHQGNVLDSHPAKVPGLFLTCLKTLLVFTVVTIIFLPLSFITSFFALAVDKFPKDAEGNTAWPLNYVCGLIFGISFAVAVPFILFAFVVDFLKSGWIQLHGYWVNILLLPVFRFVSQLPVLNTICGSWREKATDSVKRYYPRYKVRVRRLLGRDGPDDSELDQEIYYLFDKRFRDFENLGRLRGVRKDSADSGEDDSDY